MQPPIASGSLPVNPPPSAMRFERLHDGDGDLTAELAAQLDSEMQAEVALAPQTSPSGSAPEELTLEAESLYLREIARQQLLTAQEEVSLAQCLDRGRLASRELARSDESLDPGRRLELEQRAVDGQGARRQLIECNLRLVISVARRYAGRGLPFLDLVQEGNIGLQAGIDRFDWRRGYRLSTYVYWWIRQSMTRALTDQSRAIRLPAHVVELLTKIAHAERELLAELGRQPTVDEVARHLEIHPARINDAQRAALVPASLDIPVGEAGDLSRGDLVRDDGATDAGQISCEATELSDRLQAALDELHPSERQVLCLRFGLDRRHEHTLQELSLELGLRSEQIRQIETAGLAKLRRMPRMRDELVSYVGSIA